MDDSVLWVVAFGVGALGFLLLSAAGLVAMYLNTGARGRAPAASAEQPTAQAKDVASADEPQPSSGNVSAAGKAQPQQPGPPSEEPRPSGGFWAWIKAWVFAIVHAGTVSVVLGGITFFEDLANASDEIQHTGTVSFPKQLLPGTLSGSTTRQRLSQTSGGLLRDGHRREDDQADEADQASAKPKDESESDEASSNVAAWEVVDVVNEATGEPLAPTQDPPPEA